MITIRTDIEQAKRKIEEIMANPELTDRNRRRIVERLKEPFTKERDQLTADLTHLDIETDELKRQLAALQKLEDWPGPVLRLEFNDCSRLHKLKEAMAAFRIIDGTDKKVNKEVSPAFMSMQHTFVIKHDWAGALTGTEAIADDFRLPYDLCTFEFRTAGRSAIIWCIEVEGKKTFTAFVEADGYWYSPPIESDHDWTSFLWDQVKAICVALDAEVAADTVIRASHKLNERRIRDGKVPLLDYRVVDLAKRHRIANPSGGHEGGRKRLHFRRGHWSHFETSKTWVRWCLVGNPDLGFIQKHYAL